MTFRAGSLTCLSRTQKLSRSLRLARLVASAVCIGLAAVGLALRFPRPLFMVWCVAYLVCFACTLACVLLAKTVGGRGSELPSPAWPHYLALVGLLVLLVVVGAFAVITNIRLL